MVIYKIVLDTNILLAPAQFGIDVFTEIERICLFNYELFIVDRTEDELKKIIAEQRGKDKEAAKLGLSLLKAKNIKKIATDEPSKDVDSLIVDIACDGYVIATFDKELRDRIRAKHVPIIYLRNKKHLELEMFT